MFILFVISFKKPWQKSKDSNMCFFIIRITFEYNLYIKKLSRLKCICENDKRTINSQILYYEFE